MSEKKSKDVKTNPPILDRGNAAKVARFLKYENFGAQPKLPIFWNLTPKNMLDRQKCVGF